jgi:hypothetical protein
MTNTNTHEGLDPTRWRTLFVVAIAQLMIVLDSSIMNIAIPSAKIELGISDANQQWVITAYTLAFGSLLLLGGRIGDYMGRKKIFLVNTRLALRVPRSSGRLRGPACTCCTGYHLSDL